MYKCQTNARRLTHQTYRSWYSVIFQCEEQRDLTQRRMHPMTWWNLSCARLSYVLVHKSLSSPVSISIVFPSILVPSTPTTPRGLWSWLVSLLGSLTTTPVSFPLSAFRWIDWRLGWLTGIVGHVYIIHIRGLFISSSLHPGWRRWMWWLTWRIGWHCFRLPIFQSNHASNLSTTHWHTTFWVSSSAGSAGSARAPWQGKTWFIWPCMFSQAS